MGDFKKLAVWQAAHELVLEVYRITSQLPRTETYGLTSQIRRAASSIPANIAEGCGKLGDPEFARYLRISLGSAAELEYFVILLQDLNLIAPETFSTIMPKVHRVQGMLVGLSRAVKRSASK